MEELISVVVLTYNSATTVEETLNSIRNQTYPNIEIVVSDDASVDNTISVVQQWIKENGNCNIKLIASEENKGIPYNCNQGIDASNGKYIKLIAGDDIFLPNAIEKFYDEEKNKTEKNIIFQSKVETFGNAKNNRYDYVNYSVEMLEKNMSVEEQQSALLLSNFLIAPSVGLVKKELYYQLGMFDERFKGMEDYPFYLKMSMHGYRFALIDEILVRWRGSDNSANVSPTLSLNMAAFFFRQKTKYLIEKHMYKELIRQFLHYSIIYIKCMIKKVICYDKLKLWMSNK